MKGEKKKKNRVEIRDAIFEWKINEMDGKLKARHTKLGWKCNYPFYFGEHSDNIMEDDKRAVHVLSLFQKALKHQFSYRGFLRSRGTEAVEVIQTSGMLIYIGQFGMFMEKEDGRKLADFLEEFIEALNFWGSFEA